MTRSREQVIEGVGRLGRILHNSASDTIYETEFGEDSAPAVARVQRGGTPEAERLLAHWRKAVDFYHPNLLRVYAAGSTVFDDIPVIYVVSERADESLAGVLAERAMSEAAVSDLLTPVLSALAYLHKNGYAHTSLKPSNVLAVGDQLKLTADKATPVSDGASRADDVWALGALIVQSLTRKPPKIEHDWAPYILREASEPFTDLVRHCLESNPHLRWTVGEIAGRLGVKLSSPPPPPPPSKPAPPTAVTNTVTEAVKPAPAAAAPANTDQINNPLPGKPDAPAQAPKPIATVSLPPSKPLERVIAKPSAPGPAMDTSPASDPTIDEPVFDDPVAKEAPPAPGLPPGYRDRTFSDDESDTPPSKRKWIYAGVGALVVILGLFGISRQKDSAPAPASAVVAPATPQESELPRPSPIPESTAPNRSGADANHRPTPSPSGHNTASRSAAGRRADGWFVVIASYNSRAAAEKRVHDLAHKWAKFNLSVYEQKAEKTYYLVVIGQNISEDQAQALRKRAISSGLARDTYIKRFGR